MGMERTCCWDIVVAAGAPPMPERPAPMIRTSKCSDFAMRCLATSKSTAAMRSVLQPSKISSQRGWLYAFQSAHDGRVADMIVMRHRTQA